MNHELSGLVLASPILDRVLMEIYSEEPEKRYKLKSEILHYIYSHDEDVPCLSIEAGEVTIADGTDMAKGRTRVLYTRGKTDIHSLSALAIIKVEIDRCEKKPVNIRVHMDNPAGVFQIEEVLGKKIESSNLEQFKFLILKTELRLKLSN